MLLIHGLGATRRVWDPVMVDLAAAREVIAIDLPGHGRSPATRDSDSVAGLADELERFIERAGLNGVDMAGSSLGARLVLELARRGKAGASVALDPGGFWAGWERVVLKATLSSSALMARASRFALPTLAHSPIARTFMLNQLSARPWTLDADLVAVEAAAFADTPTLDALVDDLAFGPLQAGPAAAHAGPVTIGWGRHDRLCTPPQAVRALEAFPLAKLHWFEKSGHYPMWDEPGEAAALILRATDA